MSLAWPAAPDEPVVLLTERLSQVERQVFDTWLERECPPGATPAVVHIPVQGRLVDATCAALEHQLGRTDDPLVVPVAVRWSDEDTSTSVNPLTALLSGDPRRPWALAQRWLAHKDPARPHLVSGRSAHVSEIRERFSRNVGDVAEPGRFASYVSRHATLALEQAASHELGPTYKIPRLVRQEVGDSARFKAAVQGVADRLQRPLPEVLREAEADLDELVTGWGRLLADLKAQMGQKIYRLGYDEQIEYDSAQVERVRTALQEHPGVLLMSHRSHLDGVVLPVALMDNDLPRTQLLAGINMSFFPFGTLMRRAGVIFIRREFKDDLVYKAVLRQYIGYLVEKRFHLQWSIEGTRSRTGKMEPPKLGLLSYVVGALREGRASDVVLVPVSIAYDQIHEVEEFSSYAKGADKQAEGLGWALEWIRSQRRGFGKIYINFAEPISIRQELGDLDAPPDPNELYKLAFEVAFRMNRATPITGAAMVTTVLLGVQGRAVTLPQLRAALLTVLDHAARRALPLAASAQRLDTDDGIATVLDALSKHGVVQSYTGGIEPVWSVDEDHVHAASFYRNSLVHFFLDGAICELALARVTEHDGEDPLGVFWAEAFELRDLLKFDFFFPGRDEFRAQLTAELARHSPDWEEQVKAGAAGQLLEGLEILTASVMFVSFLEAYGVVADVLQLSGAEPVDVKELRRRSLDIGRQYLLQNRVHSSESVSSLLFRTGVQVAEHRGLLAGGEDTRAARVAYGWQIQELLRRTQRIGALSDARVADLLAAT
jgi:glycerol-3-phosphate O-acyltransferase